VRRLLRRTDHRGLIQDRAARSAVELHPRGTFPWGVGWRRTRVSGLNRDSVVDAQEEEGLP
jgi:hypothetical protein